MTLGNMLAETYASWLQSISFCCCGVDDNARPDVEHQPRAVLRDQPARVAPPSAEPLWTKEGSFEKPWEVESSRRRRRPSSTWSRGTAGTPWFSKSSSASRRRPKISGPSNFRHLHSESFQFPPAEPAIPAPVEKRSSFHPLELSYQAREHTFSPLLTYFAADDDLSNPVTPPPKAHTTRWDDDHSSRHHERSYSPMSFHIPRKHLRDGSFSSQSPATPPRIPAKSRARAHTSPSSHVDTLVERIASAMIEKDRLDAEIESIIERQSIYISSRPSTAYGVPDLEPMPSIPALPAAAPSFAERLSSETTTPTTAAPPTPIAPIERTMTPQERTLALAAAAFNSHPYHTHQNQHPQYQQQRQIALDRPLAPPLPLVLRPPLRKKKSFSSSRVSRWLFPGDDGKTLPQGGSVTNAPRPVRGGEGFYAPWGDDGRVFEDEGSGSGSGWETESSSGSGSGETTPRAGTVTTLTTITVAGSPVGGRGTGRLGVRGSVGVAF